jgi:hypothetical protein
MFGGRTTTKRLFQVVGNVCSDENAFPISHLLSRAPLVCRICTLQFPNRSVSRILYPDCVRMAIIHLGPPLPMGSSDLPGGRCPDESEHRAGSPLRLPIWSCTARSLPGRACHHTRRCALTAPFHPSPVKGWFTFCCTCRRPAVISDHPAPRR